MSECEICSDYRFANNRLRSRITELETELSVEQDKTDDYNSIKRDRDDLQRSANRSYDNYVTTPKGMP